jgi:DNA-binding SARP family transcriptional activator
MHPPGNRYDQSRLRSPFAVSFWKVTTIFSPALPGGPYLPHLEGTVIGNAYHAVNARLAVHDGDAGAAVAEIDALLASLEQDWGLHETEFVLPEVIRACDELSDRGRTDRSCEFNLACAEELGLPWGLARALVLVAACHSHEARRDDALTRALEMTARYGFQALWTDRERWLSGHVLGTALARGIGDPSLIASIAAACGGEVLSQVVEELQEPTPAVRDALLDAARRSPAVPAETLEQLAGPPTAREVAVTAKLPGRQALHFVGLGGFAVLRGDERVHPSEFGRARARALLGALLCAGGPVHRDQLLEWFWPDLSPERGLRAFGVTLHALRRALEPQLERGAASSVIVTQGETYAVRLGENDTWDAGLFSDEARRALESPDGPNAIPALSAALDRYGGPLFPEWQYEEWSHQARAKLAETVARLLARLGEQLVAAGRPAEAIPVLRQVVQAEPTSEGGHRQLMSA